MTNEQKAIKAMREAGQKVKKDWKPSTERLIKLAQRVSKDLRD